MFQISYSEATDSATTFETATSWSRIPFCIPQSRKLSTLLSPAASLSPLSLLSSFSLPPKLIQSPSERANYEVFAPVAVVVVAAALDDDDEAKGSRE